MKARTNEDRADRALGALVHYAGASSALDESDVTDLLTDIWHLCRRKKIDVCRCWGYAQVNFEIECEEEAA